MKKLGLIVMCFVSFCARAEELALNFNGISLPQFAQSTYRTMLKRDFVMSPELLAYDKPISVSVRSIQSENLPEFIQNVLMSQGVKSELRDGVYFLSLVACDGANCTSSHVAESSLGSGALTGSTGKVFDVGTSAREPKGSVISGVLGRQLEDLESERDVYRPRNRRSDFVVGVLNASFASKPAVSAGDVIVLTGSRKLLDKMLKLAEQVDDPTVKVRISATFVEVSTNQARGVGVAMLANVLGARLGVKLGDTSASSFTLTAGNFQAVIDAIASDGRFKQVAAPTAIMDNYEKGNLSFGDSVPTIASTTLDRNGNPIQQVTYQQSGVLLNVTPSVVGSGLINVVLDGQISSFAPTTTGVSGSPTLSKRQVQTAVTIGDGELLMIGGLNSNKAVDNSSGFSFLPKSWSARSENTATTDLVLILSASVVK